MNLITAPSPDGRLLRSDDETPTVAPTIELHSASTGPRSLLGALWRSRELVLILARKEFHVRYRRTSLGFAWALGLPLLQSVVMAVVFRRVVHIPHAPHYAVFVLSGMTPWIYFSASLGPGATAIVDNADLSSRVYFPRAVLPLVQVMTNLYGLVTTMAVLVVLCPLLGVGLGTGILLMVPAVFLLVAVTLGFALIGSALHVYFRDIRYLVTAALMMWMYVTPVLYPVRDAPGALRLVLAANPMTGVVDLFHAATVGGGGLDGSALVSTFLWAAVLIIGGLSLHCRFDRVFSDLL